MTTIPRSITVEETDQWDQPIHCACGGDMVVRAWDQGEAGWRISEPYCQSCGMQAESEEEE